MFEYMSLVSMNTDDEIAATNQLLNDYGIGGWNLVASNSVGVNKVWFVLSRPYDDARYRPPVLTRVEEEVVPFARSIKPEYDDEFAQEGQEYVGEASRQHEESEVGHHAVQFPEQPAEAPRRNVPRSSRTKRKIGAAKH